MLLGIVLHACLSYFTCPWPVLKCTCYRRKTNTILISFQTGLLGSAQWTLSRIMGDESITVDSQGL